MGKWTRSLPIQVGEEIVKNVGPEKALWLALGNLADSQRLSKNFYLEDAGALLVAVRRRLEREYGSASQPQHIGPTPSIHAACSLVVSALEALDDDSIHVVWALRMAEAHLRELSRYEWADTK